MLRKNEVRRRIPRVVLLCVTRLAPVGDRVADPISESSAQDSPAPRKRGDDVCKKSAIKLGSAGDGSEVRTGDGIDRVGLSWCGRYRNNAARFRRRQGEGQSGHSGTRMRNTETGSAGDGQRVAYPSRNLTVRSRPRSSDRKRLPSGP